MPLQQDIIGLTHALMGRETFVWHFEHSISRWITSSKEIVVLVTQTTIAMPCHGHFRCTTFAIVSQVYYYPILGKYILD